MPTLLTRLARAAGYVPARPDPAAGLDRKGAALAGPQVALYGGGGGYHQRGRLSANVQIPFAPARPQ